MGKMLRTGLFAPLALLLSASAPAVCPPGGSGTYWGCVTTYEYCIASESCQQYFCSDDSPTGRTRERHYNYCG